MAHPAEAEAWQWDDGNEAELAGHGIDAREVAEVLVNGPTWVPNRRYRAGDWKMIGETNGGRRLTVVIRHVVDQSLSRAITGGDSTAGEQARYRKGRR